MIVTLCGSTRFADDFATAMRELALRGVTCFGLAVSPHVEIVSARDSALDESYEKTMLDLVHLEKITKSDAVLVVGGGYIGKSTAREILWANMLNIPCMKFIDTWDETVEMLHGREDHWELYVQALSVLQGQNFALEKHVTVKTPAKRYKLILTSDKNPVDERIVVCRPEDIDAQAIAYEKEYPLAVNVHVEVKEL